MRITDRELSIENIIQVIKGTIPISNPDCKKRHSDCFVYVTSGYADYTYKGKTVRANAGDIIYLAYKSKYQIHVEVPDYRYIYVDFFFGGDDVRENEIFKFKGVHNLEREFINLRKLWNDGGFSDRIRSKSILYNVYAEIIHNSLTFIPSVRNKKIEAAINEIHKSFADKEITVGDLSRLCNMSEVHFRRVFSQVYQTSPVKYINRLKINKAKELLVLSDISISEVSERCGFFNPYYFSKVFKENTGVTPGEYRKGTWT